MVPVSKGKLARYILGKINDYMGGPELVANIDPKVVNLEHILPQSPDPSWKAAFASSVSWVEYVERIGNLTLLTTKINENIANQSFQKKREQAFKSSKLALNEFLKRAKKWDEKEIERRQRNMAKVALQVWKL
jgi:hypothetical protein